MLFRSQYLGVYTAISRIGVRVAGDIGCYTLGSLEPWNAIDSVVCMGAGIGTALGMEKALGDRVRGQLLAVIGDSTLLHSGLGPLLMIRALQTPGAGLPFHFFDNVDPDGMARTLASLGSRLASTLVIVVSKSGGTPEPHIGMQQARRALEA